MIHRLRTASIAGAVWLSSAIAFACPLCGDNLANDLNGPKASPLGRAFFWSIIFMLIPPFAMITIAAVRIVSTRRKALREPNGPPDGLSETRF
jgi:hypothetical protein